MGKIGIITFHNSYNCGSMLESFAILNILKRVNKSTEIINFSNDGQRKLYSLYFENTSLKNVIKNIVIFPHRKKICYNNAKYEEFKNRNFQLSIEYTNGIYLTDENYDIVVAGSDQIWNITIEDFDDAYFLNWVQKAKKVAYAPSFGAKNINNFAKDLNKYRELIDGFDSLSVREENGKKWIKDLSGRDAELLLDPTLLLNQNDYNLLLDDKCTPNMDYIFFYCPGFNRELCKFVKKVSKKYKLPVIVWSTKSYYTKAVFTFGFKLPDYESPAVYLSLIKNAKLIFTTSFHGTIFSSIYKKIFYTLKNGGMYGDDDRVITLLKQLKLEERLIEPVFEEEKNYLEAVNYKEYESNLEVLRKKAIDYIKNNVGDMDE